MTTPPREIPFRLTPYRYTAIMNMTLDQEIPGTVKIQAHLGGELVERSKDIHCGLDPDQLEIFAKNIRPYVESCCYTRISEKTAKFNIHYMFDEKLVDLLQREQNGIKHAVSALHPSYDRFECDTYIGKEPVKKSSDNIPLYRLTYFIRAYDILIKAMKESCDPKLLACITQMRMHIGDYSTVTIPTHLPRFNNDRNRVHQFNFDPKINLKNGLIYMVSSLEDREFITD